jgi:NitT/TauT family transport system substrate-binding protein
MRLRALFTLLLSVAFMIAGCGGSGGSGSGQSSPSATLTPVSLTVGVIPIVDVAPIYLGVQQGFFGQQGLDLTLQQAQGGAAIVPAVVSGQYQFGFSNIVSELLASSRGLKLKIVSQGVQATDKADSDYSAVLVKPGSSISDCKGLEGKTIAVNTLKNIGDVTIKAACEKKGANVSSYKFIEMGFTDMLPALQKGTIDAMWTVEPFVTQAKQAGAKVITYNYEATAPHLTIATYFTTADYATKSPDVVRRFVAAINRSLDYATAHASEVRQTVTSYTKIPAAAVQAMVLPYWSHDLNKSSIDKVAALMQKYGLVSSKPDVSKLYTS